MMAHANTMLSRFVDGIYVVVHSPEAPSDEEWNRHCQEREKVYPVLRGVLVFTAGGAPSSRQRERLRAAAPSPAPPTAIMTESALVRGTIASINWFVPSRPLSAFAHNELEAALRHVARGATIDVATIVGTLHMLARELSVELPKTWPDVSKL